MNGPKAFTTALGPLVYAPSTSGSQLPRFRLHAIEGITATESRPQERLLLPNRPGRTDQDAELDLEGLAVPASCESVTALFAESQDRLCAAEACITVPRVRRKLET